MRCRFVSRSGQNVRQSDDAVCCLQRADGSAAWSGRAAAAAQLALVVAAASLLDEWSTDNDSGHPHERNRDKEREGDACAPAPGNRHRDPQREHRGDDHSTPPHDPWKCVPRRCASPVESQTLEAPVGRCRHNSRTDRRRRTPARGCGCRVLREVRHAHEEFVVLSPSCVESKRAPGEGPRAAAAVR
jgi:hypothetical protein